jgi:hypothetical protein
MPVERFHDYPEKALFPAECLPDLQASTLGRAYKLVHCEAEFATSAAGWVVKLDKGWCVIIKFAWRATPPPPILIGPQ